MSPSGEPSSLRSWARRLKRDVAALWIAAKDARTPKLAKLVAAAVVAYALSPIDLIPDFIPVLGYLDDLMIVPAGIWLAVRLIPNDLMTAFRAEAEARGRLPASRAGLIAVLLLWVLLTILGYWIVQRWA